MRRQLLPAVRMLLVLTVVCGLTYPLAVTAVAQLAVPDRADGQLLVPQGQAVGSALQGQVFTEDRYFHARPSAAGAGYDGSATSGSNLGPSNPELRDVVARRVADYRRRNGLPGDALVPVDAVTASGSGLDPHISPANARLQMSRVAAARELAEGTVAALVDANTTGRMLGVLGEPAVNVVTLNLSLDEAAG